MSLPLPHRTAGIILAGGQSSRFGQPKALLIYQRESFIRRITRIALDAGLEPVIVVTGAANDEIKKALEGVQVQIVENTDWNKGQSTSLQAGLRALPAESESVLFLLADQPLVSVELLEQIKSAYQPLITKIIVPRVAGKRANPVLFDRSTFPQLMALQGDIGGRAIFSSNPITWVEWENADILLNINTPEDYQALLAREAK